MSQTDPLQGRDLLAELHAEECAHGATLRKLDNAEREAEKLREQGRKWKALYYEAEAGQVGEGPPTDPDEIEFEAAARDLRGGKR